MAGWDAPHDDGTVPPSACADSTMSAGAIAAALGERAEEVCERYLPLGRRSGRYWTVGDLHGSKGRSMWVRLEPPGTPGKWVDAATGEHGDLLDLIRHHVGGPSLGPALEEARSLLSIPDALSRSPTTSVSLTERTAAARRVWNACQPIDGTPAEAYLRAREIERCRFTSLRFHPELLYRDEAEAEAFPAMVAAVTNPDGEICAVQRTWLDPASPSKARVRAPRKALGPVHGHTVRLMPESVRSNASLVVGEGIETVLSVLIALHVAHGAAALSASGLTALDPPRGVTRLLIARDNDAAGEGAAELLRLRCRELGIPVVVLVPERGDFNDDLVAVGASLLAERLQLTLAEVDR